MMQLVGIQRAELDSYWDRVEGYIAEACVTMNGRMIAQDIEDDLRSGDMQLWLCMENNKIYGVIVTEIYSTRRKKYAKVNIVTGYNFRRWIYLYKELEGWAKANNCDGIETIARKGWDKFLDWKQTHIFLEKEF